MKKLFAGMFISVAVAMAVQPVSAAPMNTANTTQSLKAGELNLVNIAGKERMLSQAIAKDYLYAWQGVAADKAKKALSQEMAEFKKNIDTLSSMINDPEIENLIQFVLMSYEELQQVIQKKPSIENAQLVLDLTESMLEGAQYITSSVKEKMGIKESKIIDTAGKQRMLAQRIAKYYIAYQSGIKDKNTVDQMNAAVKEFSQNQDLLLKNPDNTATINRDLNDVEKLWKVVYKFYLNIEKGGLPFIVYKTTDDISRKMDKITKAYIQLYQGK